MVISLTEGNQGTGSLGIRAWGLLLKRVENEVLGGRAPYTGSQQQHSLPPASAEDLVDMTLSQREVNLHGGKDVWELKTPSLYQPAKAK